MYLKTLVNFTESESFTDYKPVIMLLQHSTDSEYSFLVKQIILNLSSRFDNATDIQEQLELANSVVQHVTSQSVTEIEYCVLENLLEMLEVIL